MKGKKLKHSLTVVSPVSFFLLAHPNVPWSVNVL